MFIVDDRVDDLIYVDCSDYLEDMNPNEMTTYYPRSTSPTYSRGRLSPEQSLNLTENSQRSGLAGLFPTSLGLRNGGGGKVYVQNEFRSAHGASRNTSRAPSVHVDDFY